MFLLCLSLNAATVKSACWNRVKQQCDYISPSTFLPFLIIHSFSSTSHCRTRSAQLYRIPSPTEYHFAPNTISHRIPSRTEYHLAPNIISHRIPSRSTSCIIEASLDPGNDIIQYLTPPSTSIPKFRSAVSVPLINKVPAMSLNCGKRQRSPASTDHHHQRRSKSSIGHPVIADEMELDTVDIELSPDRVLVANTQPHNVQTQNFFTSESPHLSTASGIVCSGAHSCAQRKRPMWFMSLDSQKADIHNCVTCRILNNVHTRHKRIVGDDCLYVCAEKTIHALSKMAKKQLLRWKHQLEWHREDMDPVPSESAR